ncbi:MAG TPA: hydroxyisourate hydrolase [Chloroflexota bacterium]|nr:hydroxyisourate hydrolase [Chloroflexota bacterium]
MARLTTHVLDLAAGRPAAGVTVELYFLEHQGSPGGASETRRPLASAVTGENGRPPRPLLEAASLPPGTYELVFRLGSYFRASGVALPEPAFLDRVPVRFGVSDPEGEYHVPLLVSPWGYSTYRGS